MPEALNSSKQKTENLELPKKAILVLFIILGW
jgi:hypothetical protein